MCAMSIVICFICSVPVFSTCWFVVGSGVCCTCVYVPVPMYVYLFVMSVHCGMQMPLVGFMHAVAFTKPKSMPSVSMACRFVCDTV